jgi:hypothetical protein
MEMFQYLSRPDFVTTFTDRNNINDETRRRTHLGKIPIITIQFKIFLSRLSKH